MDKKRRQFFYFILVAIIEHIFVIAIVAALIYTEPAEVSELRDAVTVTLEEIKKEPEPPLKEIVIKKPPKKKIEKEKKLVLENKKEIKEELPTMPKIKVIDSASVSAGVPMKLPSTIAQIADIGSDTVLRASEIGRSDLLAQNIAPDLKTGQPLKDTRKPQVNVFSPIQHGKGKSDLSKASEAGSLPGKLPSYTEYSGPISDVARPGFVGDIRGEIAGRRVIAWPNLPDEIKGTQGGSTTLEITVDPTGNVINVKIIKKSGSPKLDKIAMDYVEQIRFEALPKNVQQRNQKGEVTINFELARGN
ncbi:MAG: energy transducer TonB [bacterium]